MAQKIIWANEALSDLEDIANFIAKDSEFYAATFVQKILQAGRSLVNLPTRGRVVPELANPGIREIFIENYRLIYTIQKSKLAILGLIHGRRDLSALWRKERREI